MLLRLMKLRIAIVVLDLKDEINDRAKVIADRYAKSYLFRELLKLSREWPGDRRGGNFNGKAGRGFAQ